MRTIQKILWYSPFTEYEMTKLIDMGLYNGIGTQEVNLDKLVDEVFNILQNWKWFDKEKSQKLRRDINQLIIRHDLDTHLKIWFLYSNRRLAFWLFRLLYHFPFKYRCIISIVVYKAISWKTAKENYKINH